MTAKPREPSLTAQNDAWTKRASLAAVAEARKAIKDDGAIPPGTPVGRLTDRELGWIVSGALFGWISTRAQQATEEGWDQERTIRTLGLVPMSHGTPARSWRFCLGSLKPVPISIGRSRSPNGRVRRWPSSSSPRSG